MRNLLAVAVAGLVCVGCAPLGLSRFEVEQAARDRQSAQRGATIHYERTGDIPASVATIQAMAPYGSGAGVFTTGRGQARNSRGERTQLQAGEPVDVISIDPDSGLVVVNRRNYNTTAIVTRDALEMGHYTSG